MDTWVSEITHVQSTVTHAVRDGEPESSPRLRQLVARLERLERPSTGFGRVAVKPMTPKLKLLLTEP